MESIIVIFLHPTTDQFMEVQVSVDISATAIINELIAAGFIPDIRGGYALFCENTRKEFSGAQTLCDAGAVNYSVIRVVSVTNAEDTGVQNDEVINVIFLHPTIDQSMEVQVSADMSAEEIIDELIACNFIPDNASLGGYSLLFRGTQKEFSGAQTLRDAGATNDSVIRVIPVTCAGGFDPIALWQTVYPYLDQIGTVAGFIGAVWGFGQWLMSKFGHRYGPNEFVHYIAERKAWNPDTLAARFSISGKEAKAMLKAFGYQRDKNSALYVKTARTDAILKNIDQAL